MSWIRDHFAHFVIPAMRAMVRHRDGTPQPRDVKPLDVIVRPAAVCKYQESGLVYTTLASMLPKQDQRRERLLALCRTLDPESFTGADTKELAIQMEVSGADIVHSMVWSSLRSLKRRARELGGPMILPGRDVWPWEVISRRQRLRTVYDSRISRLVADHTDVLADVAKGWPIADTEWDRSLVFDTGWNGSIHRLLCKATKKTPHSLMLSANDGLRNAQLFPGHTGSRAKAIAIEHFPKYFQRANVALAKGREIVQGFEPFEEFVKTALLTIWLWHYVSPRKVAALKERAKAIKEAQKKHKMQIADAPTPGYQFSNAGVVAGQVSYFGGGAATGGGYIQMPYVSVQTANNVSTTTPFYATATYTPSITNDGQSLGYTSAFKKQSLWSNHNDLDQCDEWTVSTKKSLYSSHMQKKQVKIKVSADAILEAAQLHGKDAAQELINAALEEAETVGEVHGSHMALQGPTGPTQVVGATTGFVDVDGKMKWAVADQNGMLHKTAVPPGAELSTAGGKIAALTPTPPGMKTFKSDDKLVTYVDPNDFVVKSIQTNLPVATDASGKPLFA